jgi:hypothetical protein
MKLIKEEAQKVDLLTETVNGQKTYFIEGVFLMAETMNRNGRIYPIDILSKEVNRYNNEYIKENRAVGELGHPDTPTIILKNVSHNIVSLVREGNNFIGKAKILESLPQGKIAASLLREGIPLGVSSRGVGSLKESRGAQVVQNDFYLTTAADIVSDPSAPKAFVKGILENKEWVLDSGIWKEEEIYNIKRQLTRKTLTEDQFLNQLNTLLSQF